MIKIIKTNRAYEAALKRVEDLWLAKKNTPAYDELELLTLLIEKYETEKFPILPPHPIDAIKFRLEQMGFDQTDLAKIIGANRASEILNGQRDLSINMIRTLHKELRIPIESLLNV